MGSITVPLVVNNENFNEECPVMELGVLCVEIYGLFSNVFYFSRLAMCPLGGSIPLAAALEPQTESPSASRRKTQPISDTKYFI